MTVGTRRCDHRDHDRDDAPPAIAVYEGIDPPAGTVRFGVCKAHAEDFDVPPVRYLDGRDDEPQEPEEEADETPNEPIRPKGQGALDDYR